MVYGDEIFEEFGQKILEMNREGIDLAGFAASRFWLVDLIHPRMHSFFHDTPGLISILSTIYSLLVPRSYISTSR